MRILRLQMGAVVAISLGGQLLACGSYGSGDSGVSVRGADGDSADANDVNTGPADTGNGAAESTQESDGDSTPGVAGASGSSSAGDTNDGAPASSAGAVDDECPTEYDLPNYDGDVSGLCDPTESALCHCPTDVGAVEAPDCSPDGTACIMFGNHCVDFSECGWGAAPACPALAPPALLGKVGTGSACITDRDCGEGHYCNQRVANRMFCDNVFVARAEDLCPKPPLDSGVADGGL